MVAKAPVKKTGGKSKGSKKTGGRVRGTPNKTTAELIDRIKIKYGDYCPVEGMCEIALDKSCETSIRLAANKEVAQYMYPKRKAIEHTVNEGNFVPVIQLVEQNATKQK